MGANHRTSVMVAVLTGRERHFWIHPTLLQVCMGMVTWAQQTRSQLMMSNVHAWTPVDAARNEAVRQFLKSGAEWLLQIDNDVVPPANVLSILDGIEDRKIIALPSAIETSPGDMAFSLSTDHGSAGCEFHRQIAPGWSQVDAAGTGCFLTHRDVFTKIAEPWFECVRVNVQYTLEDIGFCRKARAAGFAVWTHSDFPCSHHKTIDLMQHMIVRFGV